MNEEAFSILIKKGEYYEAKTVFDEKEGQLNAKLISKVSSQFYEVSQFYYTIDCLEKESFFLSSEYLSPSNILRHINSYYNVKFFHCLFYLKKELSEHLAPPLNYLLDIIEAIIQLKIYNNFQSALAILQQINNCHTKILTNIIKKDLAELKQEIETQKSEEKKLPLYILFGDVYLPKAEEFFKKNKEKLQLSPALQMNYIDFLVKSDKTPEAIDYLKKKEQPDIDLQIKLCELYFKTQNSEGKKILEDLVEKVKTTKDLPPLKKTKIFEKIGDVFFMNGEYKNAFRAFNLSCLFLSPEKRETIKKKDISELKMRKSKEIEEKKAKEKSEKGKEENNFFIATQLEDSRCQVIKGIENENILKFLKIEDGVARMEKFNGGLLFDFLHKKKNNLSFEDKENLVRQLCKGMVGLNDENFPPLQLNPFSIGLNFANEEDKVPTVKIFSHMIYPLDEERKKENQNWFSYKLYHDNSNCCLYSLGVIVWEVLSSSIPYEKILKDVDDKDVISILEQPLSFKNISLDTPKKLIQLLLILFSAQDFYIDEDLNKDDEVYKKIKEFIDNEPITEEMNFYFLQENTFNTSKEAFWQEIIELRDYKDEHLLSYLGCFVEGDDYTQWIIVREYLEEEETALKEKKANSMDVNSILAQFLGGLQFIFSTEKLKINCFNQEYLYYKDDEVKIKNFGISEEFLDAAYPDKYKDIENFNLYKSFVILYLELEEADIEEFLNENLTEDKLRWISDCDGIPEVDKDKLSKLWEMEEEFKFEELNNLWNTN